jgi:hypothetical protein
MDQKQLTFMNKFVLFGRDRIFGLCCDCSVRSYTKSHTVLITLMSVICNYFNNKQTNIFVFNIHGSVHCKNILIYIQQDATLHNLFYLESTCFGWYLHPSSGAQTTVSTASGICHTVTATCRYSGGWRYYPKQVEQFPGKINCVMLYLVGYILEYFCTMLTGQGRYVYRLCYILPCRGVCCSSMCGACTLTSLFTESTIT